MRIRNFEFWIVILIFTFSFLILSLRRHEPPTRIVKIQSRNLSFVVETRAATVEEFLKEQGFPESISPVPLRGNDTIRINRPVDVVVNDGGTDKTYNSAAATVNDLLLEQKIELASTDRVSPPLGSFLGEDLKITIDRIVTLPVAEREDIPFDISRIDNPFVNYGKETVVSPGVMGLKERAYLITYKNGVAIARKFVSEQVLQQPVTEERSFGTRIEIEEERIGRASWYAYKGCLCAAHPFYDKGRYVRVTAIASGKSVIVRINDRGPELDKHPDRVIDLDSVAYKLLAPLGSGTIEVQVELFK